MFPFVQEVNLTDVFNTWLRTYKYKYVYEYLHFHIYTCQYVMCSHVTCAVLLNVRVFSLNNFNIVKHTRRTQTRIYNMCSTYT
jgi:hypothetical protein